MNYSKLKNTTSSEMCEFFIMLFSAQNKAQNIPALMQTMSKTVEQDDFFKQSKKINILSAKQDKILSEIDRLSGSYGYINKNYAKLNQLYDLYNTINQSILKRTSKLHSK
ncbi:MAG: hypothetical protein IKZ34_01270 [Alphaproteobacteria bacterium]|nr:hypothetical protein [Alphaproteobacteria bacterium]